MVGRAGCPGYKAVCTGCHYAIACILPHSFVIGRITNCAQRPVVSSDAFVPAVRRVGLCYFGTVASEKKRLRVTYRLYFQTCLEK